MSTTLLPSRPPGLVGWASPHGVVRALDVRSALSQSYRRLIIGRLDQRPLEPEAVITGRAHCDDGHKLPAVFTQPVQIAADRVLQRVVAVVAELPLRAAAQRFDALDRDEPVFPLDGLDAANVAAKLGVTGAPTRPSY